MEKLKAYLKSLSSPEDRSKFAFLCGTTIGYIRKVICSNGSLFFGPVICRKIEENSSGLVSRKDLRPNDWHELWPELCNQSMNDEENAA